jgi:transposase-like protein
MDLKSFKYILRGEDSVKRYLAKSCWKDDVRFCIRCQTRKIYRIRRDRYRCSQCGYEFSDFAGRWINKVKLPPRDWLRLIKLFELENSARKASQQLGISYPTVYKAFQLIRQSIAAHSGNDTSFFENRRDYRQFTADYGRRFSRSDVRINMNGADGFWSYAKERMDKFHGISKEKFPFYLKEMEFRYNHRYEPIFNTLVQYLCDLTTMS